MQRRWEWALGCQPHQGKILSSTPLWYGANNFSSISGQISKFWSSSDVFLLTKYIFLSYFLPRKYMCQDPINTQSYISSPHNGGAHTHRHVVILIYGSALLRFQIQHNSSSGGFCTSQNYGLAGAAQEWADRGRLLACYSYKGVISTPIHWYHNYVTLI